MSDIKPTQPASGQHVTIPAESGARLVFDFPAENVTISRTEGSNSLNLTFEDGASIELQDFYSKFTKENMPEFEIEGQLVAGEDFFNAFGPDLAPAAGPSSSAQASGSRYHEYANAKLMGGVGHLNGLDIGFDNNVELSETEETAGLRDDFDQSTKNDIPNEEVDTHPDLHPFTPISNGDTPTERTTPSDTSTPTPFNGRSFRPITPEPTPDNTIPDVPAVDPTPDPEDTPSLSPETPDPDTPDTPEPDSPHPPVATRSTEVRIDGKNVFEGDNSTATFTVTLSNPPLTDTVVTVQIGEETYEVPINTSGTGTLTVPTGNKEDPYIDPSSMTATVTNVTGGGFTDIDLTNASTKVEIKDTIDDTTVTITASNREEGEKDVAFDIQLTNAPDPSKYDRESPPTVQVKVGETIHNVPVDATGKGRLELDNTNTEDVYLDASSVTAKVVGVTGGNYENVVTGQTAEANIADTINDTTVKITTSNIEEGEKPVVFDVELSNKPQANANGDPTTVQVKVGETTYDVAVDENGKGKLTIDNTNIEDVYLDASSVTATVVGVTGGNYENVVTGQTAKAQT